MSFSEFFRRLLFHVTCATLTLCIVLLIGEKFVPGSVLPFVDVVDLVLALPVLLVLAAFFPVKKSVY